MKRLQALLLLLAMLVGIFSLVACDGTPSNVTLGENDLILNGSQNSGSGETEPEIGDNESVDLPYLPAK